MAETIPQTTSVIFADRMQTRYTLVQRMSESREGERAWERDWSDLWQQYQPIILAYAIRRGFSLHEAEDFVNPTMLALGKYLRATPYDAAIGRFRNIFFTILRRKIADAFKDKKERQQYIEETLADENGIAQKAFDAEDLTQAGVVESLSELGLYEVVIKEAVKRGKISQRDQQIFERRAQGDEPEELAKAYSLTRNNIDQIRNTVKRKMLEFIRAYEQGENPFE